MWAPIGGVPLPVVVVGAAGSFTWWFPPSTANPIPVIDRGGPGSGLAGLTGPFAPSLAAPWPLHIVAGPVPSGIATWWPPTIAAPWPVVLVTGITPADVQWRPPSAVNPWPVYFV